MRKHLIIGGAGFIGSHVAQHLVKSVDSAERVVVYDNLSSGTELHLAPISDKIEFVFGDVKDLDKLSSAMQGIDVVYLFAANPDIAKAVSQPNVDFWEGTFLVNNTLEAMRVNGVRRIVYASGSGVYGETGQILVDENFTPMRPISTYGASKLAGEALVCSYCSMFGMVGTAFRFANVVGPKQTHGVGYDFIKRLLRSSSELEILGDGSQNKSYIYIDDIVAAIRVGLESDRGGFNVYNVATDDLITVKEIADIACRLLKLTDVAYKFTGGDRGWKGDVPLIRLNSQKIRSLGWSSKHSSEEAIHLSMESMATEFSSVLPDNKVPKR